MELSATEQHRYREALVKLAATRPARDLLYAPASAISRLDRTPGIPASVFEHKSDCIELALVTEGAMRVATPLELFTLTPGKMLLLERGVYHAQLAPALGRYFGYWCHARKTTAELHDIECVSAAVANASAIELVGRTNIDSIMSAIATELSARSWGYASAVGGLLKYLSCILIRRLARGNAVPRHFRESPTIAVDSRNWPLVHAALEYCDSHFREGLTAADVANALGANPKHLGVLVSGCIGLSLADHLRNLRMSEAKYLLETSDLRITEVARAIGYIYPAHFIRAFKKATGVSPTAYRRGLGAL